LLKATYIAPPDEKFVRLGTESVVKPYHLLKLTCRKVPREGNMVTEPFPIGRTRLLSRPIEYLERRLHLSVAVATRGATPLPDAPRQRRTVRAPNLFRRG
jgi:hypothetical protein